MISLYIAKNNCGKTTLLNEKMKNLEKNGEECIFFPVGNEILSSINKEDSKSNNITYNNPLYQVINEVIKSNEDPKSTEFEDLKKKYSNFLSKIINDYSSIDGNYKINRKFDAMLKQNFDNNKLINRSDFLPEFKPKKDSISTGEWQISNIFSTLKWLKLVDNSEEKINIFFDEPETYLHPQYINILCSKLIELNDSKNINFYVATHNPQIVKRLINFTDKEKICVYVRSKPYDDELEENISDLFIEKEFNENEYISANKILCEIFDVYTIEYFDEILEEIKDKNKDVYDMCSKSSDKNFCENNKSKINGYCFPDGEEYVDNNNYFHKTYMSFVRNFFHHPSKKFREFVIDKNHKIDDLLEKSIEWLLNVKNSN